MSSKQRPRDRRKRARPDRLDNACAQDFPILGAAVHGKPLVYLDNAASTQKPRAVIEAVERYYASDYSNVHRGLHQLSSEATEAFEGARSKVAALHRRRDQPRDRLHPRHDGVDQPGGPLLRATLRRRRATRS